MTAKTSKGRVLSGMRPTGKLHLGNYVGALQNWVKLQDSYECFFFVADWHALTTDYAETGRLSDNTLEVVLDYLAAGLDPKKCTIFVQSHVLQHAELHVLFSMITPLGWLERVPSYKDQQQNMPDKDLNMYGFLGYPLLQAADILIYRAGFVPVGEDQVAHVELTREVARRFNTLYPLGKKLPVDKEAGQLTALEKKYFVDTNREVPTTGWVNLWIQSPHPKYGRVDVFPEPQPLLTPTPKLLGTDKRKMSKSYGNTILLSDGPSVVEEKVKNSVTDRPRLTDIGNPDECPVGNLHQIFSDPARLSLITKGCTSAGITCVECKSLAVESVNRHLDPIRKRRQDLADEPAVLQQIIKQGAARAAAAAEETMIAAREAIGLLSQAEVQQHATELVSQEPKRTEPKPQLHLALGELEGLDNQERGARRRQIWLDFVTRMYPLRDVGHRTYVTNRNRRIGIASSGMHPPNRWNFTIGDRHYDVLVMLCHDQQGDILDFIVPRNEIKGWATFLREGKDVRFHVRRVSDQFYLEGHGGNVGQEIRQYLGNYRPLG